MEQVYVRLHRKTDYIEIYQKKDSFDSKLDTQFVL